MNEHQLRDKVTVYLRSLAPDVTFEKRWGGGIFQKKGVSDYTGCAWGHYFAIEIKHPNEPAVPSSEQEVFLDKVRAAGGSVLCANDLRDVKAFIRLIQHARRTAQPYHLNVL